MNVKWRFGGTHPFSGEFLGCVTTDDPQMFKLWVAMNCPSGRVVCEYQRSEGAIHEEGGWLWRINTKIPAKADQLIFKLTWGGA